MFDDISKTITEKFEEYGKPILDDLMEMAKKYGACVVVGLVAFYLWKKFKK